MKSIFAKIAVTVFVAATSVGLNAQSQNVVYGRTTVTLNPSFLSPIQNLGATVTMLDGTALTNGSAIFPVIGGSLNLNSAAGEIFHSSGYLITAGPVAVRLQNFIIDTSNTATPLITGLLIVNDQVVGRIPVFSLIAPPGFSLPLTSQAGVSQLNNVSIFVTPTLAAQINGLFQQQVVQSGQNAGTESQYQVLASTPTGSH